MIYLVYIMYWIRLLKDFSPPKVGRTTEGRAATLDNMVIWIIHRGLILVLFQNLLLIFINNNKYYRVCYGLLPVVHYEGSHWMSITRQLVINSQSKPSDILYFINKGAKALITRFGDITIEGCPLLFKWRVISYDINNLFTGIYSNHDVMIIPSLRFE